MAPARPLSSLGGVLVSGRRVLVGKIAVFLGRHGVCFRVFVLADLVMMGGLMVMMRSGMVMSGGGMMMRARRMFRRLRHILVLLFENGKPGSSERLFNLWIV
jgi:hypothetical protein